MIFEMAALKISYQRHAEIFQSFHYSAPIILCTCPVHALVRLMADLHGSLRTSEEKSSKISLNHRRVAPTSQKSTATLIPFNENQSNQ